MHPYRNLTLLALCQAVLMTGTSLLVSTSALVGSALADSPVLATVPLGLQFLAMTVATVPVSLFMQRHGRRAGFMAGMTLGLAGVALATVAILEWQYWLFCVAAVLLGAFNGSGQFYRFAAADVAPPERKGRAISLVLAGGIAAGFLGPNLGAWTRTLLGAHFAGSYMVLGGVYLVGLLAIAGLRIPLPPPRARGHSGRGLAAIARQPRFVLAVATAAVGYGVMNLVMVATPLAMRAQAHLFPDTAFVIQWHVLAMFVPSFFTGEVIRRLGLLKVMALGVVLMAVCVGINVSGTGVWHYWAALVCLGVGWNFMFIGGTTLLTETYTEAEKGRAQACNDFIVFATVTLTALSAGSLLDGVGWSTLNLSVLPFLAAVLAGIGIVAGAPAMTARNGSRKVSPESGDNSLKSGNP
ncbi:Riboflavin transporter RfnT [wastewater metagenome]|uniref:Riboflavin transporter RfnT n=2 Tax=unclassified sequences TaxID=12908 RepID=A0A5B8RGB7_9ZZZZ|nr:riboflavin transporter RfnT [uncultured organism]